MGSCFSIQLSVDDQALYRIFRCLCGEGYIRTLKKNLKALEREMKDLKAIQHDVQDKVEREEARHQQRLEVVKVWLTRVESIDTRFKNVLSTSPAQLQKLCLCGLCSKNVCSSNKYGEKVFLLLDEVKKLKSEGNFEVVTKPAPRSEVEERPTRSTIGQDKMLEKAWNRLMEDGVGIMGLHGMGGVGKTTLFKKIHNKFANMSGRFGAVIWVVVSQGAKISKLQEDIAKKLHLCDEDWKNKNESDKADEIHRVLKGNRFVLMLDDIWEKVDLEAIGVPFLTRENGCKVAFTTRFRDVCEQMGDHEPMQVNCLEPEEAWELFKNKVGDNTLRRDPVIVKLARKVAEECRGLPLALSVIGEAMASKTMVQEWEHAIDVLTTSAAEFSDIEQLPVCFHELKKLTHLKLASTTELCSLGGISKDSSLKVLHLLHSNVHGDVSLVKELQLLEHLQDLAITISTEVGLELILGDQRLANCITGLEILGFQQKPFDISLLVSMENLRELWVTSSHVSEISTNMKCRESETDSSDLHSPKISCSTNLSSVYIHDCHGMKDFTWLLFAPNLVNLVIGSSDEVEEIINKEKATNLTGITPFQKLEYLFLNNLPKLESIYRSPLPFPFWRIIYAKNCPKLRKLPLNATSVPLVEEFAIIIRPREQVNDLEWEGEDTKNRFLPSINRIPKTLSTYLFTVDLVGF